jgi:hypothetical protein
MQQRHNSHFSIRDLLQKAQKLNKETNWSAIEIKTIKARIM